MNLDQTADVADVASDNFLLCPVILAGPSMIGGVSSLPPEWMRSRCLADSAKNTVPPGSAHLYRLQLWRFRWMLTETLQVSAFPLKIY